MIAAGIIAILMLVQVYFFWEGDVMGSTTVVHSTTLGYDTQLDELRVLNAQLESKVTALEANLSKTVAQIPSGPAPMGKHGQQRIAMISNAFTDFEESGILKEHILAPNHNMCGRFAFIGGKAHWCGGIKKNGYKHWAPALKALNMKAGILKQDVIWNTCFEDMGYATRDKPKGLYLSKASHPSTWDIAAWVMKKIAR